MRHVVQSLDKILKKGLANRKANLTDMLQGLNSIQDVLVI